MVEENIEKKCGYLGGKNRSGLYSCIKYFGKDSEEKPCEYQFRVDTQLAYCMKPFSQNSKG